MAIRRMLTTAGKLNIEAEIWKKSAYSFDN